MKIITWTVRIIVLLILLWLALQNNQLVLFTIMDGLQFDLPLIVLLFVFFILGVLLGVLMLLPKHFGLKWEGRKLRKENEHIKVALDKQTQQVQQLSGASNATTAKPAEPLTDLPPFTM